MLTQFRYNSTGRFAQELKMSINSYNSDPVDLTNSSRLFIKFRRPNGKETIKDAILVDSKITASITLDEDGDWTYTVGVEYDDGTIVESVQEWTIWVI